MEAIVQHIRVMKHFGLRMFKYSRPQFGFSLTWHVFSAKYQPTIALDLYKWGFRLLWDFYPEGDGGRELF